MSLFTGGYFHFQPESAGVGASPGFSFGRSGNVSSGAYLNNESVPSNTTGRAIALSNARITGVIVRNQNSNTFTVEVEEHDGSTFTSLGTFSVTSSRGDDFLGLNIPLTSDEELAVSISAGSCKNPVVIVFVKGDALG